MSWNDNNNGYDTYGDENRAPRQFTPREGDWDCPGCGKSNFAKRTECFKCQERRPEGMGKPAGPPPGADRPDRNYNWASNRARYEYNSSSLDEKGMAPRDAELEKDLFETGMDNQTTLDFSRYENIPIRIERGDAPNPIKTFEEADLHPVVKENIRLAKYSKPTPVQQYSIPIVTEGKDLMACAQTGSGKTAAFLIPALSALFDKPELAKPRCQPYEYRSYCAEPLVLILAPTRELCSQIFDECRRWTYRGHLRPCAVYGGANSVSQIRQLERGCDILAAAPGRLMDFIERRKVSLNRVRYLILDEADRMLDMGFEGIIRNIVEKRGLNTDRQTLMFSATFPRAIRKLARDFLRPDYLFLKVGRVGGTTNSITQKVMYVPEEEKREALRNLLNSQPPSRTLIFVETKRSADSLDQYLFERSFPSTSIHGDRTQMEREDALLAFKYGKCPILVATAVAARGIDIRNVMHVINYDMPNDMDEYIHRIGRTARVGKSGLATSFYNERSEMLAPELTKLLKENGQDIPDFLEQFITDNVVWEEDLDEENVPVPSYAGQKWAPQEKHIPGGPGSFANNATNDKPTGAADATWDSSNTAPSWDSGNAGGDISGGWDKPATVDKNTDAGWGNDPAPTASSGGWDSYDDNSAPASGGWGSNEDSAPAASSDGWGYNENSASNNSAGWGGAGETTTNDSYSHNYSNQRGNYNRSNDNGERRERRERREPSRRRDGDWDCSCGALNYSRRTECYKCQSPKNNGANGDNSNNNSSNWGSSKDASWQSESIPADSNTDGGWGNNNSTPAADNSADGGWGASSESAPAADTSDWASSETTAPAATSGGWEESTPATTNDDSGWGTPSNAASGW